MPINDDRLVDRPIGTYLQDEFKALNAHIPRRRRPLSELLKEAHPQIGLSDGSTHSFRRKELEKIAEMLDEKEPDLLLLPILLEVSPGGSEFIVRSPTGVEARLLSKVLNMDIACRENRITLYKRQLDIIRTTLKTSTQYVFTP